MSPQTQAGASAGISVVGSLFAGLGQAAAGKQEQAAYDYNAAVGIENMKNASVANEQRYAELVGRQATAYAAAGVDITSGSPLLMMAATAGRGGRQAEQIREQGTEAAALQTYYGKIAAWRGRLQGMQTFLKGISKAATGYLSATDYQGGDSSSSSSVSSPTFDTSFTPVTGLIPG